MDEAQRFVTARDAVFAQTARQQKAVSVYLTQARSNYRERMSGEALESLLGVSKTKIFHCNGDPETNEWAQRVISEDWRMRASLSAPSHSSLAAQRDDKNQPRRDPGGSVNISRAREPRVLASDFSRLRCGGPPENTVQAILFQSGRVFRGGRGNTIRLSFRQPPESSQ